ncbi:MAG: hypothetical protein KAI77_05405 [Gammaproteobacteria bacterium]|nr:hypothetical protein [Gammaproteobacteria bacterium]
MPQKELSCLLAIISITLSFSVTAGQWSGYLGTEFRYFTQDPRDPRQHDENLSLVFEPEYYHEWDKGTQSLAFVPFFRLDQHDNERTHFDIRELTWLKAAENWELRVGLRKVFWGVTEFQHLVDIINQTDLVENIDTEDKLGQPMINLALINDWGTVDLFIMPYFRERTFPGIEGRPRNQPVVDEGLSKYESSAKEKHIDFAVRYSNYFGDWDVGVAHFYGTSRDPRSILTMNSSGAPVLTPFYDIINQTSIDLQATKGDMLWKLEALHRSGQGETYNAVAGGFEYTFVGIFDSVIDLGVLGEYHYDGRGEDALTFFEDDIATGMRFAFNDAQSSEALVGLIWDRNTGGKFLNIEASRRIGNDWMLEMESRFLFSQSSSDPAFAISRDDYLELFLTYNF